MATISAGHIRSMTQPSARKSSVRASSIAAMTNIAAPRSS
jgi:hypothetical protein